MFNKKTVILCTAMDGRPNDLLTKIRKIESNGNRNLQKDSNTVFDSSCAVSRNWMVHLVQNPYGEEMIWLGIRKWYGLENLKLSRVPSPGAIKPCSPKAS